MGCCSPNFRKTVLEQEEKVNEKGQDTLPIPIKIGLAIVFIGSLFAVYIHM